MKEWTGYLQLQCERRNEKTILKDSFFSGAFKITRPVYLDQSGQACFYIMNPGGGYVDGDAYRMEVTLEEGAEVLLTTQSSTKIYKTLKQPVIQETEIRLKKGSVLEYLPDPVIAYEQARFKQRMTVRMEEGASFLCTDILTPGWAPDGSWFRYDLLQSRLSVYKRDELILGDHLKLEPDLGIQELGGFEGYTHLGTMIAMEDSVSEEYLSALEEEIRQCRIKARIGLSMLGVPGFALRVLAHQTQDIERIFGVCHRSVLGRRMGKTPAFLRKY